MRKQLRTLLSLAFFLSSISIPFTVFAGMPDAPTDETESANGIGDPDAPAPIDGGLLLLLSAGAGYGIKKYKNAKENRSTNE